MALSRQERRERWKVAHPDWKERQRAYERKSKARPTYKEREQRRGARKSHVAWGQRYGFGGIDGEADNDGNYDMLKVWTRGPVLMIRPRPGRARVCLRDLIERLPWLFTEYRKQTKRVLQLYGYALGYDFDQLIGNDPDLTLAQKMELVSHRSKRHGAIRGPGYTAMVEVVYGRQRVRIQNGKKVVRIQYMKGMEGDAYYRELRIHDAFSLFASPEVGGGFLNVCQKHLDSLPESDRPYLSTRLDLIREGKAQRGAWVMDDAGRDDYNTAELEWLVALLEQYYRLCDEHGFNPRSFAGPAPLARAAVVKYGASGHIKPDFYDDKTFQESATMLTIRRSYFGGNVQASGQGILSDPINADLRSAYPAAIAPMCCTAHGYFADLTPTELAEANRGHLQPYAIYTLRFTVPTTEMWGPFPVRGRGNGVCFPAAGEGAWATPEVQAFFDYGPAGKQFDIFGGIRWVSTCESDHPFHTMIHDMYDTRRRLKAEHNPAERIFKLAPNSLYGILAQTAGSYAERDESGEITRYKTNKHSNLFFAAYVTATCRAMMYKYARLCGTEARMIMTDGMYLAHDVPALHVYEGDGLGQLEIVQVADDLNIIAPGVVVSRSGKHSKMRGISQKITWDEVLAAQASPDEVIVTTRREYVTLRDAFQNGTLRADWGTWVERKRVIVVSRFAIQSKRDVLYDPLMVDSGFTVYPIYRRSEPSEPYQRIFDVRADTGDADERPITEDDV